MNEIIFLLGRRKALTEVKRRKLREELEERLDKAKNSNFSNFDYFEDEDFKRIISFCPNSQVAVRILGKVVQLLPELRGPRAD